MIAVLEQTVHLERGTLAILSITFVETTGIKATAQSIRAIAGELSKPFLFILCFNFMQNFITYM